MVRTRGGHCYRPRVRFSTHEKDDAGTSTAADAHSPGQAAETPHTFPPATTSEEVQTPEPPSRRYQTKVGPRAPSLVHQRPRRRARPPSGPGHQARGSLRDLGPSRRLLQLIRVHRPSYHRLRGSSTPCSPAIRFQGTWIYVPETSMGSHTMTYQC